MQGSYVRETIPGLGRQDKDGKWQNHWLRIPVESTFDIDCAEFRAAKPVNSSNIPSRMVTATLY